MVATFAAELCEHDGEGSWHLVTVPAEQSEELRLRTAHLARGFGSLRVRATVGATTWATSLFPSSAGPYLLPVKEPVRRGEQLEAGDVVDVDLEPVDL